MKSYFVRILSVSIIGITNLAFGEDLSTKSSLADDIFLILNSFYPNADVKIVTKVDKNECEISSSQPGMIMDDLNGDGKSDYAVLAQIRKVKSSKKSKDEDFDGIDITLLALMQNSSGSFDKYILENIQGRADMKFIELVAPGTVIETQTNRKVHLKTPGVALVYCGKSQVDFYWDRRGFKQVWISD
jgi:hypothetical protein